MCAAIFALKPAGWPASLAPEISPTRKASKASTSLEPLRHLLIPWHSNRLGLSWCVKACATAPRGYPRWKRRRRAAAVGSPVESTSPPHEAS